MGEPDPLEIRRGEAQHPVRAQHAPALAQEGDAFGEREVLEEVLREDERHALEGKALAHVQDSIDAVVWGDVDVRPAGDRRSAGADVESHTASVPWPEFALARLPPAKRETTTSTT